MRTSTQKNVMRVAALLLLLQCSRTSQAMDLVMYHSERQDSGPGWHDLKTVKSSLERAGHKVGALRVAELQQMDLAVSALRISRLSGISLMLSGQKLMCQRPQTDQSKPEAQILHAWCHTLWVPDTKCMGYSISDSLDNIGASSESCMCMGDVSPQVEATRAGKMLGTLAMSFENITDFEGVLVQGKVAQEGEATPTASLCIGNMSHLPATVMHRI